METNLELDKTTNPKMCSFERSLLNPKTTTNIRTSSFERFLFNPFAVCFYSSRAEVGGSKEHLFIFHDVSFIFLCIYIYVYIYIFLFIFISNSESLF